MTNAPPSGPAQAQLQRLLGQAMALHRGGQLSAAEPIYLHILKSPLQFEAQCMLGLLRSDQGRYQEAVDLIGAALKTRPESLQALSIYNLTLLKAGRLEEALSSFDKFLALRPDTPEALCGRATTLHRLARYDEALTAFDRALAVRPNDADAWYN